jgi:gamma-glutamyl-gamma-aminobutyraldehyde dehydrogenase/4-guanidinobutyraldehyde dehydrogenase/NAD-dependent aldehyde dehydrogenase
MDIDAVAFTGSSEVGKFFLRYSGESNMKSVSLECGGKSPNIVFADAPDLAAVAKQSAGGIFYNSGQVCDAASRLIVEDKIHDKFMDALATEAKAYTPSDPLDPKTTMGSVVDENQMKRVLGYIDKGKSEGAQVAVGGKRVMEKTGGFYVEPTVFDNVKNDMTIAREEIFGPVLTTISFKDPEEAVKIANDTIYGLGATIWTRDLTRAHMTAKAIRAGTVMVNTPGGGGIEVPFGGYKQSGFGRDKSLHALEKYTQLKTTLFRFV